MNILFQFSIILLISLAGEALSFLIPLPIPARIYGLLLPARPAYAVITLVSTLAVMAVSGLATQAVIRRKPGEGNRHE